MRVMAWVRSTVNWALGRALGHDGHVHGPGGVPRRELLDGTDVQVGVPSRARGHGARHRQPRRRRQSPRRAAAARPSRPGRRTRPQESHQRNGNHNRSDPSPTRFSGGAQPRGHRPSSPGWPRAGPRQPRPSTRPRSGRGSCIRPAAGRPRPWPRAGRPCTTVGGGGQGCGAAERRHVRQQQRGPLPQGTVVRGARGEGWRRRGARHEDRRGLVREPRAGGVHEVLVGGHPRWACFSRRRRREEREMKPRWLTRALGVYCGAEPEREVGVAGRTRALEHEGHVDGARGVPRGELLRGAHVQVRVTGRMCRGDGGRG